MSQDAFDVQGLQSQLAELQAKVARLEQAEQHWREQACSAQAQLQAVDQVLSNEGHKGLDPSHCQGSVSERVAEILKILEASEERYHYAIDASTDGIWDYGSHHRTRLL